MANSCPFIQFLKLGTYVGPFTSILENISVANGPGVYIIEQLLILFPPPAFDLLPRDATYHVTKSDFLPHKAIQGDQSQLAKSIKLLLLCALSH